MAELTQAQRELASYMSELSDEAYCASWIMGLEFALWEAVLGKLTRYGNIDIKAEQVSRLKQLSEACGGWIRWTERNSNPWRIESGEEWVSLDDWRKLYADATVIDGEFEEASPAEQDWFFTFGSGHHYPGRPEEPLSRAFVRIRGTYDSARARMVGFFGIKWSHQYASEQAAGVDEYGLVELDLPEPEDTTLAHARVAVGLPPERTPYEQRLAEAERQAQSLVPVDLREAYLTDATVQNAFNIEAAAGGTRETALIEVVNALLGEKVTLTAAVLDYARNAPPPVLHFDGPPPAWLRNPEGEALSAELRGRAPLSDVDRELLTAVLAWRAQGRKSKWTTAASRHLVEVVDRLRERYPELCETLTAEPDEERPPCPECHQPMARFAGPGSERGWTCVRCEASDG